MKITATTIETFDGKELVLANNLGQCLVSSNSQVIAVWETEIEEADADDAFWALAVRIFGGRKKDATKPNCSNSDLYELKNLINRLVG